MNARKPRRMGVCSTKELVNICSRSIAARLFRGDRKALSFSGGERGRRAGLSSAVLIRHIVSCSKSLFEKHRIHRLLHPPTTSIVDTEPHPKTQTYVTKPALLAAPLPPNAICPPSNSNGLRSLFFSPCTCTPPRMPLATPLPLSWHGSRDPSQAWLSVSHLPLRPPPRPPTG